MRGLGIVLVMLGVAYGWGAAVVVARRSLDDGPFRRPPPLTVLGAAVTLGSLLVTYADGHSRSTGRPVRLPGWDALDPVSLATLVVVALAAVAAGRLVDEGDRLVTPTALHAFLAAGALAVLAGKWLVYRGYDHFGPAPEGFAVAVVGALLAAAGGLAGRQRRRGGTGMSG